MISKISKLIGFSEDGIKRYSINTMWLFIERFITLAISFFVGVALIRYLGPHNYGIFAYATSIYAIILNVANMNFNDVITRESINKPEQAHELFGTVVAMRAFMSMLLLIIATIFVYYTNERSDILTMFLIMASVIHSPFSTITTYFNAIVKSKFVSGAVLLAHIATSVMKVALIMLEAPLIAFAFVALLNAVILSAALFYLLKVKNDTGKRWTFKFNTMTYLLRTYWVLLVVVLLSSISNKLDILVLKDVASVDIVGIYNSAHRIIEVLQAFPMLLLTSLFPAIISSKQTCEIEYTNRISKILRLLIITMFIIALTLTLLSDFIIGLLYTDEYNDAATVLAITSWMILFSSMQYVTSKWLVAEDHVHLSLIRIASFSVIKIPLIYFAAKMYGLLGVSVAMLITSMISGYFIDLLIPKTREIFVLKTKAIVYPIAFIFSLFKSRA